VADPALEDHPSHPAIMEDSRLSRSQAPRLDVRYTISAPARAGANRHITRNSPSTAPSAPGFSRAGFRMAVLQSDGSDHRALAMGLGDSMVAGGKILLGP
jgi:hypothetical protein